MAEWVVPLNLILAFMDDDERQYYESPERTEKERQQILSELKEVWHAIPDPSEAELRQFMGERDWKETERNPSARDLRKAHWKRFRKAAARADLEKREMETAHATQPPPKTLRDVLDQTRINVAQQGQDEMQKALAHMFARPLEADTPHSKPEKRDQATSPKPDTQQVLDPKALGVAPPSVGLRAAPPDDKLPHTEIEEFFRPHRGMFLAAAGVVAVWALYKLDAPLWLGLVTLAVLIACAAFWPWFEKSRPRRLVFWASLGFYALGVTVVIVLTSGASTEQVGSHAPTATPSPISSQTPTPLASSAPYVVPQTHAGTDELPLMIWNFGEPLSEVSVSIIRFTESSNPFTRRQVMVGALPVGAGKLLSEAIFPKPGSDGSDGYILEIVTQDAVFNEILWFRRGKYLPWAYKYSVSKQSIERDAGRTVTRQTLVIEMTEWSDDLGDGKPTH